jgi:phosphatidylinositol alpha-1,6-mannosyltransferase
VLEALAKVVREAPNVKYLIAGDGPEKDRLQEQARQLGIADKVIFAGDVPHGEIRDFYNLCDVFIMANRLEEGGDVESFGMVFTEANAVGKPVIGGRSGGTAEAVLDGKTGFLADPGNADEIAQRLLLLLENEDLAKRMGSAGLARVRSDFNWPTRAQAVREISAEMVMRARRNAGLPAIPARPGNSGVSA